METAIEKIMSIWQEGTVTEYSDEFQFLFNQVKNYEEISEYYAIYLFMNGLKPEIRDVFITWHQYSCIKVEDVISLALKIDSNGLKDSFSPFDPNSCFYSKDLEFDINIPLNELMKDNELFWIGMTQETCDNIVLEKIEDEVIDNDVLEENGYVNKAAFKVFDKKSQRFNNEMNVGMGNDLRKSEKDDGVSEVDEGIKEHVNEMFGNVIGGYSSYDSMNKLENEIQELFVCDDAKENDEDNEINQVLVDLYNDIHEKNINGECVSVCNDIFNDQHEKLLRWTDMGWIIDAPKASGVEASGFESIVLVIFEWEPGIIRYITSFHLVMTDSIVINTFEWDPGITQLTNDGLFWSYGTNSGCAEFLPVTGHLSLIPDYHGLMYPKCVELKLPREGASFCIQDSFKASWSSHKSVHLKAKLSLIGSNVPWESTIASPSDGWLYCLRKGQSRTVQMPHFGWTGPLRPYSISKKRLVLAGIELPDWAVDGIPKTEPANDLQHVVEIKSAEKIVRIRETNRIAREVLDAAARVVGPGVTTDEIEVVVHEATIAAGAYPFPLNYHFFPKSCCTSVTEVICHGIPDARKLEDGDIVKVDISFYYKGVHGVLNETFFVGNVNEASLTTGQMYI